MKRSTEKTEFKTALVNKDFWDYYKIKSVCAEKDGYHIVAFYQKMAFASYNWGGYLKFSPTQNYNAVTLSAAFNEPLAFVNKALSALFKYELIEDKALQGYYISDFLKLFKRYTCNALRVTRWRERQKQKALETQSSSNVTTQKETQNQSVTKALQKRYKSVTKKRYIPKASSLNNPFRKSRYEEKSSLPASPVGQAEAEVNGKGEISPNESGNDPTMKSFAEDFISTYPKKGNMESKQAIREWYQSHKPTTEKQEEIMRGLGYALVSDKWRENGGQYIPAPQNFLIRELWGQFLPPELPDRQSDIEAKQTAAQEQAMVEAYEDNPLAFFPTDQLLIREFQNLLDPDMARELKRRRDSGLIDEDDLADFEDWKSRQKPILPNKPKGVTAFGGAN